MNSTASTTTRPAPVDSDPRMDEALRRATGTARQWRDDEIDAAYNEATERGLAEYEQWARSAA